MEIDIEKIVFEEAPKPELCEYSQGDWELYRFRATYEGKEVCAIDIERLIKVKEATMDMPYFFDNSSNPRKPRPYVVTLRTKKEVQKKGIGTKLMILANNYFKEEFETPVYSGVGHTGPAEDFWNSLVRDGHAFETEYFGKERWAMK